MRIYVAASYPRKKDALILSSLLIKKGHNIVSGWVFEDEGYERDESQEQSSKRLRSAAIRDLKEVKYCDLLVCLTDGENQLTHGGRHTELGVALALEKKIVVIGTLEQVFHYHPYVRRHDTVEDFLNEIK